MHVRGEGCNNNLAWSLTNHVLYDRTDFSLQRGKSWNIGIGAVCHEQIKSLFADAREGSKISQTAIKRQLVHLEITGGQDGSGGASDDYRQ